MLSKVLFLIISLLFSACVSTQTVGDPAKAENDPWQGQYLHFSGRFVLVLDHISKEFVDVDIFELPRLSEQRARSNFAADLKNDKAIFQAGRGEKCRVELQKVERGIIVSDFCNGTGEDAGLYRPIDEKAK